MTDAAADRDAAGHGASYSVYGDVDVEALLAIAKPWAPFRVWRKGDPAGGGRLATTAGVTIDIGDDRTRLEPAILRFLMEERVFLTTASRLVSPAIRSVLTCRMRVPAVGPSRLVLSPTAVMQLASARVELEVIGSPWADHPVA